jgi:hypothetical protein
MQIVQNVIRPTDIKKEQLAAPAAGFIVASSHNIFHKIGSMACSIVLVPHD